MNTVTQSFLGRYRLVKVLGQGAMGVVYEAVDTRLNRTVAIKTVLRSHLADETTAIEYATRFEREAQAAARLAHPNVVTVYDFGEHEDISYIVMEFVRGRELNDAFEAGQKFALPEAIRITRELLLALDYAHQQGIVHRDIKPANVMLDAAGHVKLADFGVARVANATQDRTMPGTMVGTPSYMSPEQILGLAVGSRTDIFAAGVILYQFLVGKRPFAGGGPFAVQRKIVQDEPDPPSRIDPTLPEAFDHIIARALAKQPENRYETAGQFAADLDRVATTLARDVELIELDLSPTEPMILATQPEPPSAPVPAPQVAAGPLSLIDAVPFGGPAGPPIASAPAPSEAVSRIEMPHAPAGGTRDLRPPAPAPGNNGSGNDGIERTIIISRPGTTVPPPPDTRAVPGGYVSAPTQPVSRSELMNLDTEVRTRPGSPADGRHAAPPPPVPIRTPPPARTTATAAGPGARAGWPPPPGTGPGGRPPAAARPLPRVAARPPSAASRTLVPLAAGAGVAVLALTAGLLIWRPWMDKGVVQDSAVTPTAVTPAPQSPPQAAPPPAPAAVTQAAPDPAPAPTPAPAPAAPSVESTRPAAQQGTTPAANAAPRRVDDDSAVPTTGSDTPAVRVTPTPVRRPQAEAPPPARTEAPNSSLQHRCSDLLQRMQLGEPLTADQTAFFQTRCTR